MAVKGFQGTSLLDYPGRIASLVFFGGCNLSCPYCHNTGLVIDPHQYPDYPLAELMEELEQRRRFIDAVVVSGGEPTLDRQLLPFLRQVKALGLLVKLDTNGLAPKVLEQALGEGLLDYVAMDLKTSPQRYAELHRGVVDFGALGDSVALLRQAPVELEFRTTCVPGLVGEEDIRALGALIRGSSLWVLQQYVPRYAMEEGARQIEPYAPGCIRSLGALASDYVGDVVLRGL